MKRLLFTGILSLILASSITALPLTVVIFQESAKLADKVAAWNKQCGDKPSYDEACTKKRKAISAELGQFVALVNDELAGLRDISPEALPDMVKEFDGRRKIMDLEARNALHIIRCLGVPASDTQCSAEEGAIEEEKASLQAEYEQTHAAFDGKWISLRVEHVEVSYEGILSTGVVAIGGETTGVTLKTEKDGVFQLDLGKDEHLKKSAEELNGKKVRVTGDYKPRPGVEVKERRIILVKTLQAVT